MQCIVCLGYNFLFIGPHFCTNDAPLDPKCRMSLSINVHDCPQDPVGNVCRAEAQGQKVKSDEDWMSVLSVAFKADQSDVFSCQLSHIATT